MKRNLITYFLMMVLFAGIAHSGPRKDLPLDPRTSVIKAQVPLEENNIQAFFWNTGVFNQDLRTTNTPGFYWPIGTGHAAIFTTGLSICAFYQGSLRASMGSYAGEYVPGYVNNAGVFVTSSIFKLYSVKAADNEFTNPDYANWALMIPYGAPFVDVDSNGIYTQGVDKPGIKDAAQTIFVCLTDGDPGQHTSSEGFGGGSAPLFVQVALTGWCYVSPGLEDLQFVRWVVINRSSSPYEQTYMSVVVDPDLGDATDDYVGCDTLLNMAYCYNADNVDGTGTGVSYGTNPPSSGMDYFLSPIVPTGNPNDTVIFYDPPGSKNKQIRTGYQQLGLTSFVYFTNTGSPGPACENDPSTIVEAYNYMKGFKKDATPWVNIVTNLPTKFCYPGDPTGPTGWTEFAGRIGNCGGSLTGTSQVPSPPGDRRFIFNSGSANFTMNPNDTQRIILAQFVARGTNNLNAVTKLKRTDDAAQKIFDNNFQVLPPPPPPLVNVSVFPATTSIGTANINLSWGDISEYYDYEDIIFETGRFKFQGYEVYELRKDLNTVPDINNMLESKDGLSLVAIFDKKDSIGVLFDSLLNGQTAIDTTGAEVPAYSWAPVLPAFGFSSPANFPNKGLSRRINLTRTNFAQINGGSENFIYGNTYKFIVVAYGYNRHGLPGGKVIRNSLVSQLITIVPEAPVSGTQYYFKNGDTLNTSRRDLGVMPIVINQELVKEAKYRILFSGPDTTYSIFRSLDAGVTYDILKSNLKFSNYKVVNNILLNNTTADDSARVIDGILWKVQKILFLPGSPVGQFPGNAGVIKDPVATLTRDSIQTRLYGWDYLPPEHNPYDSNFYKPGNRPYQSISMSISYPTRLNYVAIRSQLNPEDLRKVKIVFTGYGNGQQAYRYSAVSATNYQYQDMREVPFKVYEIDPYDGTPTERQLNCGFLEFPGTASENNKWEPVTDTSKEVLYIFGSDYNATPVPPYTTNNLLVQQATIDVMYVWAPRLKTSGSNFSVNDQFIIYPYTVTRPEVTAGNPLYYDIDTKAPVIANNQIAVDRGGLQDVKVVPNPYYGFNGLETSTSGRFVTFRNLPKEVTVKLYSLNGDLIRTLTKNDNNSTMRWDLNNQSSIPIASGIYIALIDAPGVGTKTLKIAVFTPEERIDF